MICLILVILTSLITLGNLESISRVVLPTVISMKCYISSLPFSFSLHFQLCIHKIREIISQHALYIDAKMNRQEISQLLLAKTSIS